MTEARVAIVTGARRGIGAAIPRRFLAQGWCCAGFDIDVGDDAAGLTDVSDSERPSLIRCDVRDTRDVTTAVSSVLERYGRIDAVVNNAGAVEPSASNEIADAAWLSLLEVHLGGAMRTARAAVAGLLRSDAPSIVNISSVCASRGFPGRLSYNAAKAGVEALTRTLAVEWAALNIRVNAVAPGFILTEYSKRLYHDGVADLAAREALVPLGRLGEPDEVANAVCWLASAEASYVTGQVLVVDGGYLVNGRTGPDSTDRSRSEIEDWSRSLSAVAENGPN